VAWNPSALPRALAGSAALALAMGVGRFAYTSLLPSLQAALGFDDASGGLIASVNLAGYLAGVLWARHTPAGAPRRWLLQVGLAGSVLTTAAVAGALGLASWLVLRFAAGVASGLVFVLVASVVLEALPPGREALAGVHYGGVGVGIALSGAVTVLALPIGWQVPWLVLAALSAALAVPALLLAPASQVAARPMTPQEPARNDVSFTRLAAAYFLEGLGYIVSGTFAVRAVQHSPGLEAWAPWVWVATGLAAAPSAILWSVASRRLGPRRALVLAFGTQAIGMALPAVSGAAWAALLGALLFGGTFMGIVTVSLELARRLVPEAAVRAIGSLSAVYGVGQAIGPALAGWLARAAGSPRPSVLAAAAAVAAGGLLLAAAPPQRPAT
jgi:predicted MFS family arabinose efflux permease